MATRVEIRAESMRRLGSYQTLTVAVDPDVTDSAAQRKVITSDTYNADQSGPTLGQACLWAGRYNDGNKVKTNSYIRVAKAGLTPPTTSSYSLRIYGYGQTSTISPLGPASTGTGIQTAIRAASTSLGSVTVTPTTLSTNYLISGLPSAETTIELVRVTPSDTTGSVTRGLASMEAVRPFAAGLSIGDRVEVLHKYPADNRDGMVGMNDLINQALGRLWFVDLLHVASTDPDGQQLTYSLSAYPWLKTRRQIIRAYGPCRWSHAFSYTVPVGSHTLSLDLSTGSTIATTSLAGSATAASIQAAVNVVLATANAIGSATVTANGTTRTITISDAMYADLAVTVSTGATVTTTRTRQDSLRFVDGFRLKFTGTEMFLDWDRPWPRGSTWYLEVYRPAQTKICPQLDYQTAGTAWTEGNGLTADLDQCWLDVNEVAALAHWLACRDLYLQGGGSQSTEFWRAEAARAATVAAALKRLDLPTSEEPGFRDDGLVSNRYALDKGAFSGTSW